MKKGIICLIITMIISISLCFSGNAVAYSNSDNNGLQITLPTFKVTLNGNIIDSKNSQYPLIIYNDITYFPMTYNDSRFLGIESNYTLESGLEIFSGIASSSVYQPYISSVPNASVYKATLPSFKIRVNGKSIDNTTEQYPLLLFRDITYFPLTWRFAVDEFGWDYSFDAENGLVINSNKNTSLLSANITYTLSAQSVNVDIGKNSYVEVNFSHTGFPDNFTSYVGTTDSNIAEADWDYSDDTLPWTIIIKGISSGTTYLKISNSYNNQNITIPITVNSATPNPDVFYNKLASAKFPLHLYSNDGKTYLGKLTTNKYDTDSISNTYGTYGSKYSSTSIFNEYGTYGSKYNSQSAFNEYASSPPKIFDSNGNFIAYLTANEYKVNGITYIKLMMYLEKFNQ